MGRPGVRVRCGVGPRRERGVGGPQWRGPWVCAAPRSLPPPTHCSVTSRRCGTGPLGNGRTDFEARNEGAPTLGPVSCAPTSQARTRPVTARPTARRPSRRAWGSIGLHRGFRRKGGTRGAQGLWTLRVLDRSSRPAGSCGTSLGGVGPGPSRSPPWGRLCASRGRWGRGRAREGAGGGSRCPPSIWWRHFLLPPPGASQAGNWLCPIGSPQRPSFCCPW